MGRKTEYTFFLKGQTINRPMKKRLSIISHQENVNQSHTEISFHTCQNGYYEQEQNNNCCRGCEEKATLLHCWECKLVQFLMENTIKFFKKLKIELQCDPETPLLGIFLKKKMKTWTQKDIFNPMFISILFIIANIQKQSKTPLMDECNKFWGVCVCVCVCVWYICISAKKKKERENKIFICNNTNGPQGHYATWNKTEKDKYHMISPICGI